MKGKQDDEGRKKSARCRCTGGESSKQKQPSLLSYFKTEKWKCSAEVMPNKKKLTKRLAFYCM